MQSITPLEYGQSFHIYNRGINGTDLFTDEANYQRFLASYGQYICPDTYAWALLRNHFHILARIKDEEEIPYMHPTLHHGQGLSPTDRVETTNTLTAGDSPCQRWQENRWQEKKKYNPSRQFSHLFNAYAQYFNKYTGRHGGLFETPFRRIRIDTEKYFRQLVYYIHHNPVKHGFAEHILDWGWSSYLTLISVTPTRLCRETVLGYFDGEANFKVFHQRQHDFNHIANLLLE